MRVSAKCDYACRALLELALHWPSHEPVHIQGIANNQMIPMRYLVQILIQLKQMGLVASTRGKEGGYNLAKNPAQIRLGDVMREICGPFFLVNRGDEVGPRSRGVFVSIWEGVEAQIVDTLDSVTFEDICDRVRGLDRAVSYVI